MQVIPGTTFASSPLTEWRMPKLTLKLFGKIPLKTVHVNVIPDLQVVPGDKRLVLKLNRQGSWWLDIIWSVPVKMSVYPQEK